MLTTRQLLAFSVLAIAVIHSTAQIASSQSISSSRTVGNYRYEDSKRTYHFLLNAQKFGTLESIYEGTARHEGVGGHKFTEKLNLDLSNFAGPYLLKIENEHYVDDSGWYISDDMRLAINDQIQNLNLVARNGLIKGYLEREEVKDNIELQLNQSVLAIDNNMIDQLELFLAFRNFKVGDTINDSFFVPQTSVFSNARLIIEGFGRIPYGNMVDSAFICRFIEPVDQTAYITRDKRLIKLVQPLQNITVVLIENILDRLRPPKKAMTFSDFGKRIPIYSLFLISGIILTFPFWSKYYKRSGIYLAFILGAFSYQLIGVTHIPLQEWFSSKIVLPAVQQGGSLYAYTLGNSLLTGLVQEMIKLLPILLLFFFWKQTSPTLIILGIFCGAGYGIYESGVLTGEAYQAGAMRVISWGTFERIASLIFHMTSGALCGWALRHSLQRGVWIYIALFVLHSFTTYMIVFVQKRILDIALYEILIALIYLILLLTAYLQISGSRIFTSRSQSKRPH